MLRTSTTVLGLAVAFHAFAVAGGMLFEKQALSWAGTVAAAGAEAVPTRPGENGSSNHPDQSQANRIELQGTVVYKDLEGGFFAIDGDDGRTYHPINLPEAFKKSGMRVKATVRVRNDEIGIHMVGEIVEILDIVESGDRTIPTKAKDNSSSAPREFQTKTGKTITVSETHPVGRSLSTIAISTKNFEDDFSQVYEDQDPISEIFLADLDANGYDELYIITTSAGSGSYGKVIGFASNQDKSLSTIHFPAIEEGDRDFKGYMGHDTFKLEEQKLVRLFPVYNQGDTNQNPTGGTRKLTYALMPGEAMWQLRVKESVTLSGPLDSSLQ